MNCAEVNQKIELFVLGGLPKSQHAAIKAHLATCPACSAAEAEYRLLVTRIKSAYDGQTPSLRLDFVRAVRSKVTAEIRSIALRSRIRRIIVITASAAACLLFGLVIWHTWISPSHWQIAEPDQRFATSDKLLGAPSILQAWQHRGARSAPGSMADEVVVRGQSMYLLQESCPPYQTLGRRDGGQAYVVALDTKTGKQKWLSNIQSYGYLLADDSRVFCLAGDEAGKFYLVALDAANGKKIWKYPQKQSESLKFPCRPTLLTTGRICWTTNTTVHMLSCANGKQLWTHSIPDGGLLSEAAVVNNKLYVASAIGLYCLNIKTGDESWRLAYGDWLPRSAEPVISSRERPLLATADGDIYASLGLGFGSRLFCTRLGEAPSRSRMKLNAPKILWHKDVAHVTHMCVIGDMLYLRDQDVQALDRKTGQLLWTYSATGCNPLTYTEELAYFVDSSDQGRLIALNRYTGQKVWELAGMKSCNAFIKVDSTGFVKTHEGVIYAIIFKG